MGSKCNRNVISLNTFKEAISFNSVVIHAVQPHNTFVDDVCFMMLHAFVTCMM